MLSRFVASGRSAGLLTVNSLPSLTMHLYTTVGAVVTRSKLYSRSRRSCCEGGGRGWRNSSSSSRHRNPQVTPVFCLFLMAAVDPTSSSPHAQVVTQQMHPPLLSQSARHFVGARNPEFTPLLLGLVCLALPANCARQCHTHLSTTQHYSALNTISMCNSPRKPHQPHQHYSALNITTTPNTPTHTKPPHPLT